MREQFHIDKKRLALVLCFIILTIQTLTPQNLFTNIPAHAVTGPSFSFGAAGDHGGLNISPGSGTLNILSNAATNFYIALGDFSYGDQTPSQWCSTGQNGQQLSLAANIWKP